MDAIENTRLAFRGLMPSRRILESVALIGAGSVGSWIAVNLAKMGLPLTVYDYDKVEERNVGVCPYGLSDVGALKTEALKRLLGSYCDLRCEGRVDEQTEFDSSIIVSAVDSWAARRTILNAINNCYPKRPSFFDLYIDTRMSALNGEIYCVPVSLHFLQDYEKTLRNDNEDEPVPCHMRAITFNVMILAGLASMYVWRRWCLQHPPGYTCLDLSSGTPTMVSR